MNARNMGLVSVAVSLVAQAADNSHGCNELFDDAQRLGCYDAAFGKPVRPSDGKSVAAAGAAGAAATATATVVPAAPPAPKPDVSARATPKPDSYKSAVTALGRTADGLFIATLENGELWVQSEHDSLADVKVGDTVTLKRMLMGNYTLRTRSGYPLRVKRVN